MNENITVALNTWLNTNPSITILSAFEAGYNSALQNKSKNIYLFNVKNKNEEDEEPTNTLEFYGTIKQTRCKRLTNDEALHIFNLIQQGKNLQTIWLAPPFNRYSAFAAFEKAYFNRISKCL